MILEMNLNSSLEMESELAPSESTIAIFLTLLESNRELLDRIFVICLVCLIMMANVLMGCELDLNIVLQTIRRPIAPSIGFFTQFALMPLLAFSISLGTLSTQGEHLLALGLFVTGCSPGGGASNYWTILLGGNANLSITMTFISTIGAMVMMPLWIRILGAELLSAVNPEATLQIPYRKMVASLFSLVLPLLIGLLIAKFRPNWASKMRSWIRPFIISVLIFIIIFGVTNNFWLLKMITWRILLAGMLLPLCGFMFGCFCAILFTQRPPDVVAIAIETGVQNTGIAIMVLKLTFPGVQGNMASLLPIVVACCTPIPLLLSYLCCRLHRRFRPKADEQIDDEFDLDANGKQQKMIEQCKFRPLTNSVLILKYSPIPRLANENNCQPCEVKIICKESRVAEAPSESLSRSSSSQPLILTGESG